jgi:hypothetical protein
MRYRRLVQKTHDNPIPFAEFTYMCSASVGSSVFSQEENNSGIFCLTADHFIQGYRTIQQEQPLYWNNQQ